MPPRKSTKPRIKREPTVIQPMDMAVVAPEPVDEMDQAALDAAIAAADKEAADSGTKEKYYESVGRRKESVARVRLYTKKSTDSAEGDQALITVNGKSYQDYFLDGNLLIRIEAPLRKLKSINRFKAVVQAHGGGISGQADAVRHGIARALEKFDGNFRKKLKKAGFLTRDARAKERRKYGLKKARKAPQWSKR